MQTALIAMVVLGALTVGWDVHQEASIAGNEVACDFEGSVTVDEADPTNPAVNAAPPACSGIPPL